MSVQDFQAPTSNLHFDPIFKMDAVKILPGGYHVTDRDIVIVTILGSCVAACIRDRGNGIGGMNHFMLPDVGSALDPTSVPARYGTFAMEVLVNQLLKLGARRDQLEAKVFGGANVIPGIRQANVGRRNADFVMAFLKTENIRIVARDLEGICPRKVAYFPRTGIARIKRMTDQPLAAATRQEQAYKSQVSAAKVSGGVELFD
jgi:chemotaxis protein CheD